MVQLVEPSSHPFGASRRTLGGRRRIGQLTGPTTGLRRLRLHLARGTCIQPSHGERRRLCRPEPGHHSTEGARRAHACTGPSDSGSCRRTPAVRSDRQLSDIADSRQHTTPTQPLNPHRRQARSAFRRAQSPPQPRARSGASESTRSRGHGSTPNTVVVSADTVSGSPLRSCCGEGRQAVGIPARPRSSELLQRQRRRRASARSWHR